MKYELIPESQKSPEKISRHFELTLIDTDSGDQMKGDYYSADWEKFGEYLKTVISTKNWDESMLQSAQKPDWKDAETHEREFGEWFSNRLGILLSEAFVKNESGQYEISEEFIFKSFNPGMLYQLAFTYRHAEKLFSEEAKQRIKTHLQELLNSNDLLVVIEVLAHFGDLEELLPANKSTTIKTSNFLVKEALRSLPQQDPEVPLKTQAAIDAETLIAKLTAEQMSLKLQAPVQS